jgi:hypothetical protein
MYMNEEARSEDENYHFDGCDTRKPAGREEEAASWGASERGEKGNKWNKMQKPPTEEILGWGSVVPC